MESRESMTAALFYDLLYFYDSPAIGGMVTGRQWKARNVYRRTGPMTRSVSTGVTVDVPEELPSYLHTRRHQKQCLGSCLFKHMLFTLKPSSQASLYGSLTACDSARSRCACASLDLPPLKKQPCQGEMIPKQLIGYAEREKTRTRGTPRNGE